MSKCCEMERKNKWVDRFGVVGVDGGDCEVVGGGKGR